MTFNKELGDKFISFAVMIQSLLAILQTVMVDVWKINSDATTIYRVLLTAVPMSIAIVIAIRRKGLRFLVVYGIIILLFLLTAVIFPSNEPYLLAQGFRFLLPVVVPSALCLSVVSDLDVVEEMLQKISWFTSILVFYYFLQFFRGAFVINGYNMVFSYACLLPMVALFSKKTIMSIIASLIMFIGVLAIGSRGAALYFLIYIIIEAYFRNKKLLPIFLMILIAFFAALPYLQDWFIDEGINSRSLSMLLNGDIIEDSGRESIQAYFWGLLCDKPLLGIGLYGDRVGGVAAYCHNLFLEILLDFGLLFGSFILIFLIVKFLSIYLKSNKHDKLVLVRYLCALLLPLMTSDSYLVSSNFAIFIGICIILNKKKSNSCENYGVPTNCSAY